VRCAAIAAATLAVVGCGGSSAKAPAHTSAGATTRSGASHSPPAPHTVTATASHGALSVGASSGTITATMRARTHTPRVGAWPVRFTVTDNGRPARAGVSYEYLFGGQVVAHRAHYTFTGSFSDVFVWPAAAVGYPLTFRAVITVGGSVIDLDYPIQVRR